MNKLIILFVILVISIGIIECRIKPNFNKVPKSSILVDKDLNLNDFPYQYFTQNVDHFDSTNKKTFKQRYIVNNQYWNGTGPVFAMINGEAGIDASSVTSYIYVEWAKQVGALIVSLEHRYYGASFVTPNLSVENLKWLTVDQALADNAVFLTWFLNDQKVPSTSSVVSFGGSYAGMLTSFMKIKYPEIIDFTVSSSGPVGVELDFYQYFENTATTILSVENGQECLETIANLQTKIESMVRVNTKNEIQSTFNLCTPLESENDIITFLYGITDPWLSAAQYNDELPTLPSVQQMCQVLLNTSSDPLTNYLQLWNQYESYEGQCIDMSYYGLYSYFLNIKNDATTVGGRMWQWQLCTEFGFFITGDSPSSSQPFGNSVTLDFQQQQCEAVFGIPNMSPNISSVLSEFGGLNPNLEAVADILYVTGTNDQWSTIGISPLTNPNVKNTLLIDGTSHCGDMMPITSVSPPSLGPAQAEILQFIIDNINKKQHNN